VNATRLTSYSVEHEGRRVRVDFVPEKHVPGFTHRVAVDGTLTRMWLSSTHKPNGKSACYFAGRWVAEQQRQMGSGTTTAEREQQQQNERNRT
jgi:hypothetical protein